MRNVVLIGTLLAAVVSGAPAYAQSAPIGTVPAKPAQAAPHKHGRHYAQPRAEQAVPLIEQAPAYTGPAGNDPLWQSCEFPWRHPELSCPGAD